ncbi:VOC family protein [Labrenzia sp. VG12]|uniref:VOC family protein n=1 Tax=Labrenzia sp. VG12 TaxID=2021862 RepID=UPI0012FD5762|nr:VOC family protein [Labrenzia sp. VG12]
MTTTMFRRLAAGITLFFLTSFITANAQETAMQASRQDNLERLGVYVLSSDMERSGTFYRTLFGADPVFQTEVFVGFNIAGGLFAVVSKEAFAPKARLGGSTVPYLKVADIDAALAHVTEIAPEALQAPGIIREGPLSLFKFRDPDGNLVEYYALSAPVEGL